MRGREVRDSHGRFVRLHTPMPKPKRKASSSKGYNKNTKRRSAPKSECDYVPESAIDREPDDEEPEDGDSASLRIKISVPVAMWVCKTTLYDSPQNSLREARISGIAIQNAAQGRNSLVLG